MLSTQDEAMEDGTDYGNEPLGSAPMTYESLDEAPPPAPFIFPFTSDTSGSTSQISTNQSINSPSGTIRSDQQKGLPSEKTLISFGSSKPETSLKREREHKRPRSDPVPSKSKPEDSNWRRFLYCPQAGTTISGSSLLRKFERRGFSTVTAMNELEKYANYEFESFTFMQEIIPNLFLGRYPRSRNQF